MPSSSRPGISVRALAHLRTLTLTHFLFLLPLASSALTSGNYTYTVSGGKATITDFNVTV